MYNIEMRQLCQPESDHAHLVVFHTLFMHGRRRELHFFITSGASSQERLGSTPVITSAAFRFINILQICFKNVKTTFCRASPFEILKKNCENAFFETFHQNLLFSALGRTPDSENH